MWAFADSGPADGLYITGPANWEVLQSKAVRSVNGLRLQQNGPPEGLVKSSLRKVSKLSFADVLRTGNYLGLALDSNASRDEVIEALARHVGGGDDAYIAEITASSGARTNPATALAEDPTFNFTFDMLDEDDRREYPEVDQVARR